MRGKGGEGDKENWGWDGGGLRERGGKGGGGE